MLVIKDKYQIEALLETIIGNASGNPEEFIDVMPLVNEMVYKNENQGEDFLFGQAIHRHLSRQKRSSRLYLNSFRFKHRASRDNRDHYIHIDDMIGGFSDTQTLKGVYRRVIIYNCFPDLIDNELLARQAIQGIYNQQHASEYNKRHATQTTSLMALLKNVNDQYLDTTKRSFRKSATYTHILLDQDFFLDNFMPILQGPTPDNTKSYFHIADTRHASKGPILNLE